MGVNQTRKIGLELEPTFVGVGPYHMAAGMNNKAIFHSLEEDWKCTQETLLKSDPLKDFRDSNLVLIIEK